MTKESCMACESPKVNAFYIILDVNCQGHVGPRSSKILFDKVVHVQNAGKNLILISKLVCGI